MTTEQARVIFNAVLGMAGPTQALFEAQAADAMGELSDAEMVTVVEDYTRAKRALDNALTTEGLVA